MRAVSSYLAKPGHLFGDFLLSPNWLSLISVDYMHIAYKGLFCVSSNISYIFLYFDLSLFILLVLSNIGWGGILQTWAMGINFEEVFFFFIFYLSF